MKFKIAGTLIGGLLFLVACDKRDCPPPPPSSDPVLSVKLGQQYLVASQVDSAFAIWKVNGTEQRIRMILRNDSLLADMDLFNEGNGNLTLHIFSNKKYSNQYFGQWVSKKSVWLKKNQSVNYNGPASFYDAAWFPRVELKDAIGHEAVIALRPDDAYFVVRDPGHPIVKLTVDRGYWKTVGGIQLAGRGIWECIAGCTGIENNEYFTILPQRIGTKPWNHISIAILFWTTDDGEGWMISLEHEL